MDQITKNIESLNLENGSTPPAAAATHGPAPPPPGTADLSALFPGLPPGRTLNAGLTLEETIEDLHKHPLFMTELDPSQDNEELAALQALAYEGTPLENALNFKEQGNECFKEKRWADAKEFYGKGISILFAEEWRRSKGIKRKVKVVPENPVELTPESEQLDGDAVPKAPAEITEEIDDDPEEAQKEKTLLEQTYVNRAACHLELKNFRSCTLDCAAALRLNPSNVKALYRSAKALLAVDRIAEADDCCARGLDIDSSNAPLKKLAQDIIARNEIVTANQAREAKRLAETRQKESLLKAALAARNISVRTTNKPPDMEDARVELVPDPLDPKSSLSIPVLLLYPADYQSDLIKAFNETETLEQHFGYVLPLPWDREGKYASGTVECYVETKSGGLAKVGKRVSLLKLLSGGNVEVVDDLVKIFVLPKGKGEGYVKEWKEKKGDVWKK
ncbi:Tetratricopeptide repeat protein 4 [Podospora australis]|uniref:Tetratricopeptide repeat protein 4 n=1 Tax=Podospora australis TaxID=1536484 RepID=A0AAN7AMN7_9PEZI|nr:Tetratricopeptide repeat protein 4 [Podospora australis]